MKQFKKGRKTKTKDNKEQIKKGSRISDSCVKEKEV